MIKEKLKSLIEVALNKALQENRLGQLTQIDTPVVIERPRSPEHGDYACGVCLKLAGKAKMPPLKIAEILAAELEKTISGIATSEIAAPGYINFRLEKAVLQDVLKQINEQGNNFGSSKYGADKKVLIEYVSANPTGDLHIGHGRNGVLGSCLSNLMSFTGYKVEQEFYINDAGVQILQLGKCAWALYQRLLGKSVAYPEEGYPEDSLKDFVQQIVEKHKTEFLDLDDAQGTKKLADLTKHVIEDSQRKLLETLGIKFDRWFSETPLHEDKRVDTALSQFRQSSLAYESEGALWLKSKELGDERDRVLIKGDGSKTYLAVDAAYHLDKYQRGYDLMINVWGADHHGQIPGIKAVVTALGQDPNKLEIILTQIVNLSRDGQIVRMSKRMGTVAYLHDLIEEVGRDAVRYYLAESNPQNSINFDLELAKKTSRENPAFYIQYAHARCCAILRKALEPSLNTESNKEEPAPVSSTQWQEWLDSYKKSPAIFSNLFDQNPEIYAQQKKLILQLSLFPEEIEEALISRNPGRIARYAYEVANDLQRFYEVCRVITESKEVTCSRLGLIVATKQVMANALNIIGVTALERM